jgi:hypothetical protein
MYSTAVRCTAPKHAIDCPTALMFAICSQNSQPAARTGGNRLGPLPSAGSSWLLHIISLILKAELGLFGQILARIRPIVRNCARPRVGWA